MSVERQDPSSTRKATALDASLLAREPASPTAPVSQLHVIAFGPGDYCELDIDKPYELNDFLGKWPVVWANVEGVGDSKLIFSFGEVLDLHHLALEDVMNVKQRSKVEQYGRNEFIVARMVKLNGRLETEQLSMFLGQNFVLTFQEEERPGDPFDNLRDRIRKDIGGIRSAGPDHLMYALLDAVVDAYFPVLESYGEVLEDIEDEVLANPTRECIAKIHEVKRDLLTLRRAIWPMRDALNMLYREPGPLIQDNTRVYLRDLYDHAIRIIDLLETDRELCSDLMDVYLSSVSNKLNEVMKWLTIISALFIPPTFIVGIYGMNFSTAKSPWNMPELDWYFGYPFAWLMIISAMVGFYVFVRKKGWL